jgi:hypothetical protein
MDMVHFKSGIGGTTVGALMLPLQQEISLDFRFKQGSSLICLPLNLRVVERRCVEAHEFLRDRAHRTPALQALYPGYEMQHTREQ